MQSVNAPPHEGVFEYKLSAKTQRPQNTVPGFYFSLPSYSRGRQPFFMRWARYSLSIVLLHLHLIQISACLRWAAASPLYSRSHTGPFYSHPIGQNLVTWSYLAAREARK